MELKFDANQSFQIRAIESVVALMHGQTAREPDFSLGNVFGPVANRLDLTEDQLLANLRAVQERNNLPLDEGLQFIEETIETQAGPTPARFGNFSVPERSGGVVGWWGVRWLSGRRGRRRWFRGRGLRCGWRRGRRLQTGCRGGRCRGPSWPRRI